MEQILGQQRAVEALQSALQSGRLHHAFVFHGPKGVGKFTTARAFAGVLLCPNATRDRAGLIYACGSCRACALMQDGAHPDDHVVTKELASYSCNEKVRVSKHLTLSIDVLSENLIGPVHLAPRLGYRKVFIVNEAELITQTSQNLLLKILEEPPPGTFIILVTDNQDQLLPTIRSRCQLVSFVPLPPPLISDWICRRQKLDPDLINWLTDFAAGSLGRAELALAYGLHEWSRVVLPAVDAMAQSRYPNDLGRRMAAFIDSFAKKWVDDHDGASKQAANKQAAALLLSTIAQHARKRLHALADQCDPTDPESAEESLSPWLHVLDLLGDTQRYLDRNVNLGLVTDHLVSLLYRALSDTALTEAM